MSSNYLHDFFNTYYFRCWVEGSFCEYEIRFPVGKICILSIQSIKQWLLLSHSLTLFGIEGSSCYTLLTDYCYIISFHQRYLNLLSWEGQHAGNLLVNIFSLLLIFEWSRVTLLVKTMHTFIIDEALTPLLFTWFVVLIEFIGFMFSGNESSLGFSFAGRLLSIESLLTCFLLKLLYYFKQTSILRNSHIEMPLLGNDITKTRKWRRWNYWA